jgi:hypothetical protein
MMTDMECGCTDDYCDIDYQLQMHEINWPKARKEHRCYECRRIIKVGEKYEYTTAFDPEEKGFVAFKTCKQCATIADQFMCGCRIHGNLGEHIWETLGVDIVTGDIMDDD